MDAGAAASGELVAEVIDALGVPLNETLALCLYVAVSTDTGNFSFDCTTPACLDLTARCLETGLDLNELNYQLFRRRTMPRTKLLGRAPLFGLCLRCHLSLDAGKSSVLL